MRERPPEQTLADESLPPTPESEWGLDQAGVGEGELHFEPSTERKLGFGGVKVRVGQMGCWGIFHDFPHIFVRKIFSIMFLNFPSNFLSSFFLLFFSTPNSEKKLIFSIFFFPPYLIFLRLNTPLMTS